MEETEGVEDDESHNYELMRVGYITKRVNHSYYCGCHPSQTPNFLVHAVSYHTKKRFKLSNYKLNAQNWFNNFI